MSVVEITSLNKSYGSVNALTDINVSVSKGEIFGFIGPDGAGKTTLFRILTTLLIPDSGSAKVLGYDVVSEYKKIRPKLGYMPGKFSLYQDLSVEENLDFFASVFGTTMSENYELIEPIYKQLEPFNTRLAGKLSGGMKQKLALCCALIHKPELLFLDEPTTGVDAVSRKEFWDMLVSLKEQGISIVVSTPYMDEAKLCDRVALIQEGKTLQIDTPDNIVRTFKKPLLGIKAAETYPLLLALKNYEQTHSVHPFGEFLHYTEKNENPDLETLKSYLVKQGIHDVEIESVTPNIEDSFMALMGEEANDE
tara:strand:- start:18171 stop:19094 length:924 start_codon:yes stop_codon:yes gene_type:complete